MDVICEEKGEITLGTRSIKTWFSVLWPVNYTLISVLWSVAEYMNSLSSDRWILSLQQTLFWPQLKPGLLRVNKNRGTMMPKVKEGTVAQLAVTHEGTCHILMWILLWRRCFPRIPPSLFLSLLVFCLFLPPWRHCQHLQSRSRSDLIKRHQILQLFYLNKVKAQGGVRSIVAVGSQYVSIAYKCQAVTQVVFAHFFSLFFSLYLSS